MYAGHCIAGERTILDFGLAVAGTATALSRADGTRRFVPQRGLHCGLPSNSMQIMS